MAARFGRRMRKGVAGTAVAAAAMAALTASQAPGLAAGVAGGAPTGTPPGPPIDGGSPYITTLPPLNSPTGPVSPTARPSSGPGSAVGGGGIPATVYAAYLKAESTLRDSKPGCRLPWQLLAAIGQVESGQADGGNVDAEGTTLRPILGPVLDGTNGNANIPDTDGGRWDGDPVHDRAVGPMQFIPSTRATWGADGNGDGIKDPNNIFDAALAAGDYLCAVGGDLSSNANMDHAILGYNHSQDYLNTVTSWYEYFRKGAHRIPDGSGATLPGSGPGTGRTPAAGPSPSASPSGSPTGRPSPSRSPLPTASASGSIGPTPSAGGSPSPSPSGSGSPSPSPSPTCPVTSPSPSPTGSGSPSPTPSPTPTPTPSPTGSGSPSPSPSPSPTGSPCPSPSPTTRAHPSPSAAPSHS